MFMFENSFPIFNESFVAQKCLQIMADKYDRLTNAFISIFFLKKSTIVVWKSRCKLRGSGANERDKKNSSTVVQQIAANVSSPGFTFTFIDNYYFSFCTRDGTKTEKVGWYPTWPWWYKNLMSQQTINVKVNSEDDTFSTISCNVGLALSLSNQHNLACHVDQVRRRVFFVL